MSNQSVTLWNDGDTVTIITFNGEITTAVVMDDSGVVGRGHAKCVEPDYFDSEVGRALAVTRAHGRYARKKERSLLRKTR